MYRRRPKWAKRRRRLKWIRRVLIVIGMLSPLFLANWPNSVEGTYYPEGSEIYVIDGDTISYAGQRIRLQGFDTPEIRNPECAEEARLGEAAKARVQSLIAQNENRLEILDAHDKYGRDLGRLFIDGRNIREILTSEGLAQVYVWGVEISWC